MAPAADSGKHYHRICTGAALETVNAHQDPAAEITLFGSCFCPFVQRAWVAFEYLDIPYKNITHSFEVEVDPYQKPKELLEVSPKGLVPGLRLNKYDPPRAVNESTVIMEFLEESVEPKRTPTSAVCFLPNPIHVSPTATAISPLAKLPLDARALVRLQSDHVNRSLIPAFYRYIQAQDETAQIEGGKEFLDAIEGLVSLFQRAEKEGELSAVGLWRHDGELGWADVSAGPCAYFRTSDLGTSES
ncbi:hypothetical protein HWV62_42972 [Athelia sp. TMB]|nr:hypothetical protein HWV62_42972 [Athelia sp. TMB]